MKKISILFLLFLFSFYSAQNNFHDTQGNIEVNGSGQLEFTLPIALPPAVKSVAPQVNLIYTSGSGNGIAGYGWNISGITSISRIGRNIEKDGEIRGIRLDYSDYYSFNGQRLILKSGEYGRNGAEYITEKFSNVKIKSVGTLSGVAWQGPEYWEVTFEDGSQAWYGATASGASNARTPNEYNIVKWKDAQGNTINYNYEQVNNIAVIKSITWGGGNEILNKPDFNTISFNYIIRDLKEKSYVNGVPFVQDKLLSYIVVETNGTQFKKYVIEYLKNGTNYQFTNKITEYNSNNEAATPVIFDYPTLTSSSVENVSIANSDPFDGVKLTGDFNGDSYLDFVMSNGTIKLGAFNDNFTTITTNKNFNSDALVVNTLLDEEEQVYNGNGIVQYENGKVVGYIFRDNTFTKVFEKLVYDQSDCIYRGGGAGCRITTKLNEADIDGDGIANILLTIDRKDCEWMVDPTDQDSQSDTVNTKKITDQSTINRPPSGGVLYCTDAHIGNFVVDLKNSNLPVANYTIDSGINYTNTLNERFLDVDGDGKVESINVSNTAYTVFEFIKTGANQYLKKIKYGSNLVETKDSEFPVLFGDFNGDGKLDFTIPVTDTAIGKADNWRFYIGRGNGFDNFLKIEFLTYRKRQTSANNSYVLFANQYFFSIADINRDGKSDIVQTFSYNQINYYNTQYRNYGYVVSTKLANGTLADGSLDFITPSLYISPQESVRDVEDLTLYTPLTNPIKANNNYYNVFIYWKQKLKKIKAPTSLAELSRIKSITQAGIYSSINYWELNPDTNPNFYKKEKKEYYPFFSLQRADQAYAVSQIQQGQKKQDFRYRGLTTHLQGKGMLGFRQMARSSWYADGFENTKIWAGTETDPLKEGVPIKEWSIKTNDENQIFPSDISLNNNQLLSVKLTDYKTDYWVNGVKKSTLLPEEKSVAVMAMVPTSTTSKDFMTDITTIQSVEYNSYYLPIKTTSNINNNFAVSTTQIDYYPPNLDGVGNQYSVGRPKQKIELMQAYGDSKGAKEEYAYENNQLKTLTSWNNDNTGWIRETYTYDGFGNIIKKEITNSLDGQTKSSLAQYDDKGRFVIKKNEIAGSLNLETHISYNNWGQVLTQKDPLGVVLTNTYDAWGKILTSNVNLSGTTTYQYQKQFNGDAVVMQLAPDGNQSSVTKDKWGREYLTTTKGFNSGTFISKMVQYDILGRKTAESEPYITGQTPTQWNRIQYDDYSRPIKATAFTGKVVETIYEGRTVTTKETNADHRFRKQTSDALGNVITSEDKGGVIHFRYNAANQNIEARYDTNIVTTKYDNWGRKAEFNDPSNGTYRYEYKDGFGKITKEISPKGYKEYRYNGAGQLITQIEKSNDGSSTQKRITYTYNAKGLLLSKSGTANGEPMSSQSTYDTYGRLLSTTENSFGKTYGTYNILYDDNNRITSYERRLGSNGKTTQISIENIYHTWNGELYQLKDKTRNKVLWQLNATNAKGQVTDAQLGAVAVSNTYDNNGFLSNISHSTPQRTILQVGYSFNAIKNELNSRVTGGDFNIIEQFVYDDFNRLVNWTDPATGGFSQGQRKNVYDSKGRIVENDGLGIVKFDNPTKIYQATGAVLNPQGEQNLKNNLIQSIQYNENNDPVSIEGVKGDYLFAYGLSSMRQRMEYGGKFIAHRKKDTPITIDPIKSPPTIIDPREPILINPGFPVSPPELVEEVVSNRFTKYYSEDGAYEIVEDHSTGLEKHIIYIGGSPYESDIIFVKDYNEGSGSYRFLHKDYLGSILAISDEAGNKVEQRHYDAWGNLTHLQIGTGKVLIGKEVEKGLGQMLIDRGYTSHEHLAEVGLIHMNGRLYDPILRRFLNADEHIQDPYNTQNYNKYSYVLNNPLMYNDPSGELFWFSALAVAFKSLFWAGVVSAAIGGAIIGTALYLGQAAITGNFSWGGLAKAFFGGALTGAVSGALGQVFSAGSFWATVGNGALAGAGSGGINSIMNGTNFLEGIAKGAVIGGAIGAVSYAINFYSKGYNKMKNITEDIEIQGYEQNGDFFKSNEELKQYVNKEIGNAENIESKLKTDLQLANSNNLPSSDYSFSDNFLIKNGNPIGGTASTNVSFFSGVKSKIYISPGIKGLTSNGISATKMIINHELIHAYHFSHVTNPTAYVKGRISERVASTYSYVYAREYGFTTIATKSFYNTVIKHGGFKYTMEWSFRKISRIINLGVK